MTANFYVGEVAKFAMETCVSAVFSGAPPQALGSFVISVAGTRFGLDAPDATMLNCTVDTIKRRIQDAGKHVVSFTTKSASEIVDAYQAVVYDEERQEESFFDLSAADFRASILQSDIVWAPDGDAAFDDGGHVLQFDIGSEVWLIAFKNVGDWDEVQRSIRDVRLQRVEFYSMLENWLRQYTKVLDRLRPTPREVQ